MKPLVFALFAALLYAQEPAGVIEGGLRDALTHAPLAGARISIHGAASRSATTDTGGSFRFEQLAPGEYELAVQKAGYLDSVHRTVRLQPGAVTETVVIDLTPLGAIEGAVLEEAGKPLAGVSVNLGGVSHVTDTNGHFAFGDVVPGSYQVAVGVPHNVRTRNLVRDSGSGDYYGYAPAQYYPGADDPRLAIPVAIAAGVQLRNIDLRLRRTLLVEFTGRLIDMAGREPIPNADVQLTSAIEGPRDPLWTRHAAGADGSFRFSLIQPGAYTLAVFRPDRSPLPYFIPIEIGKTGADDLPVSIPPFPNIQGAIHLRDPKLQWSGSATIRVTHRSGISMSRETRPDGSFEFESVPPGDYRFDVQARNLRLRTDPARRLSAKGIAVTVIENGNPPLDFLLTDDPAGISGSVVDPGASARTAYVVAVAALAPLRAVVALTIATPSFQFPELEPGEYEVTATRGNLSSSLADRNKTCDETLRVTVRDGAVSTVTLRPCP